MFETTQREPERIPPKLLIPILESGSLEEDDELQDRWAALLVNSSGKNILMPGAPEILRQLSSFEVLLLQMCFETFTPITNPPGLDLNKKPLNDTISRWYGVLVERHNFKRSGMDHHYYMGVMMDNLTRLGLIKRVGGSESIYMTTLGFEFISLCQTHL